MFLSPSTAIAICELVLSHPFAAAFVAFTLILGLAVGVRIVGCVLVKCSSVQLYVGPQPPSTAPSTPNKGRAFARP